jgi:hypothetical protein
MGWRDWFSKGTPANGAPEVISAGESWPAEDALISRLLVEHERHQPRSSWWDVQLDELESYREVATLEREAQARLVGALASRCLGASLQEQALRAKLGKQYTATDEAASVERRKRFLQVLLSSCMRKALPYGHAEVQSLLQACTRDRWINSYPIPAIVAAVERYAARTPLADDARVQLHLLAEKLRGDGQIREHRRGADRIAALLGTAPAIPLKGGEAWSDAALVDIESLPSQEQNRWTAVLNHCATATSGSPSAKWIKAASTLLKDLGEEDFKRAMVKWLPLVDEPRTAAAPPPYSLPEGSRFILDEHMDILRGLAWMCGLSPDSDIARALTKLTISAFRKIPGIGPRAIRVGNAGIAALGMMPGIDAVGQLALLKVRIKLGTAQIALDKALTAAAQRAGLTKDELEEMSVPAYGLMAVGRLVETLGEITAELEVIDSRSVKITWHRADARVLKSLPAAVKTEFPEEVREMNAAKKDLERMLPVQSERIESLFFQQKRWPLETWLERYLEHPLVGTIARRLIWNFNDGSKVTPGLWLNGKIVDRVGHPVPLDVARTAVTLWHPLDQPPQVVLGWRGFLEEWEIRQPFKQAHREVYLLTPAEERTRIYSNRFAAHLLKQHQFNALCAARGWKNKLRLMVDDVYPPATRLLPQWGLRAEFWIEGAGDNFRGDTNETGTYHYVATDQVRFYSLEAAQVTAHASGGGYDPGWYQPVAAEPIPLSEIPALVFSEIMRDVDLFVGVASVGNDPAWADGGRRETERAAWDRFSFGELSGTAQTRREVLATLIPKLKIAARCTLADRFLKVRGDLRTYKIHLGSGNILMEPNDQYLCIVPTSQPGDSKLFLPFEGDRTLSVILSKAFLLAADAKITDASIVHQLKW